LQGFPKALSATWEAWLRLPQEASLPKKIQKDIIKQCVGKESPTKAIDFSWPEEFQREGDLNRTIMPRMFLAAMLGAQNDWEAARKVLLGGVDALERSPVFRKFKHDHNYLQWLINLARKSAYPDWYLIDLHEQRLQAIGAFIHDLKGVCPRGEIFRCRAFSFWSPRTGLDSDRIRPISSLWDRYTRLETQQKNSLAYQYALGGTRTDTALRYGREVLELSEQHSSLFGDSEIAAFRDTLGLVFLTSATRGELVEGKDLAEQISHARGLFEESLTLIRDLPYQDRIRFAAHERLVEYHHEEASRMVKQLRRE
jgi:hypothetical protein